MSTTPSARIGPHAMDRSQPRYARSSIAGLACVLALAGCPSRPHAPVEAAALARTPAPLSWRVNRVLVTHHLSTSSLESRDALPGRQFVVLDVSVRNRDAQPQVLSEGKLIAQDETTLQTFDQPETLLSDDYLGLQVLAPAQGLRGKIAYEVPEPLSGVLYWSPGNGSERILLNPVAPSASLADAVADAGGGDGAPDTAIAVTQDAPLVADTPVHPAGRPPSRATPAAGGAGERVAMARTQPVAIARDDTPVLAPTPVPVPPRSTATIAAPPVPIAAPVSTQPVVAAVPSPAEHDLARRQACASLVTRDDPADKAGNLDFFAGSCRDYRLPPSWQPPRRSLLSRATARASSLLARLVVAPRVVRISDCSATASRADKLVCADPGLAAMDHQLAQSVARASDQVDDPEALQREQERWRGHVRNACGTAQCLEQAYGRRIAQLDALAPMRP